MRYSLSFGDLREEAESSLQMIEILLFLLLFLFVAIVPWVYYTAMLCEITHDSLKRLVSDELRVTPLDAWETFQVFREKRMKRLLIITAALNMILAGVFVIFVPQILSAFVFLIPLMLQAQSSFAVRIFLFRPHLNVSRLKFTAYGFLIISLMAYGQAFGLAHEIIRRIYGDISSGLIYSLVLGGIIFFPLAVLLDWHIRRRLPRAFNHGMDNLRSALPN